MVSGYSLLVTGELNLRGETSSDTSYVLSIPAAGGSARVAERSKSESAAWSSDGSQYATVSWNGSTSTVSVTDVATSTTRSILTVPSSPGSCKRSAGLLPQKFSPTGSDLLISVNQICYG